MTHKFLPRKVVELTDGFIPIPRQKEILEYGIYKQMFKDMALIAQEWEGYTNRRPYVPEDFVYLIDSIVNKERQGYDPKKSLEEKLTKKAREYITPDGFTDKGWKAFSQTFEPTKQRLEHNVEKKEALLERAEEYIKASKKANEENIPSDECFTDLEYKFSDRQIFDYVYPTRDMTKQICRENGKRGVKYRRLKQVARKGNKTRTLSNGEKLKTPYDNEENVLRSVYGQIDHNQDILERFERAITEDLNETSRKNIEKYQDMMERTEGYFLVKKCIEKEDGFKY